MQGLKYNVDIIMCIDCTGSMSGILDTVKANALKFYPDLKKALADKDKHVDKLRIKVIAFRDYYCDGDKAMSESKFFTFPDQEKDFQSTVSALSPSGGGDEPENGMEALALAIKSDWDKTGDRRREIVIMWTDASAHPLEKGGKPSNYPVGIPGNFGELSDWWDGQAYMNNNAKRFLLFGPDAYPWADLGTHWENTVHYPSKAGQGLAEYDYESILASIVKSV